MACVARMGVAVGATLMSLSGLVYGQLIDQTKYQGRLEFEGVSADGPFMFLMGMYDAEIGGSLVSATQLRAHTFVTGDDGVFTFNDLAFGIGVFTGADRWLEITVWAETVAINGVADPGEPIATLPRQPVTSTPQAHVSRFALSSGTSLDEAYNNGNRIRNSGLAPVVVEGRFLIDSTSTSGFEYQNPAAGFTSNIIMSPVSNQGASLKFYDENFGLIGNIQPDVVSGEGAYFEFAGNGGSLIWDGDSGTATGSTLTIAGLVSSSQFSTFRSGDFSVELPANSIGPSEMAAEAGVANVTGSNIAIPTSTAPLLSRSITVPIAGYIFAVMDGDLQFTHTSGAGSSGYAFGVANQSSGFDVDTDHFVRIPSGSASGTYNFPMSSSGLYQVAAGTHTFFALGRDTGLGSSGSAFDVQLTLQFYPTAYGTVVSNLIDPESTDGLNDDAMMFSALTDHDIEAEYRAELARRDREIAALFAEQQRQLDQIRAELEATRREQGLGNGVLLQGDRVPRQRSDR